MEARIMGNAKELREKRYKIAEDAKAILDGAAKAGRDITGEERAKVDAMFAEVDSLKGDIERVEKSDGLESELRASLGRKVETAPGAAIADDKVKSLAFRAWATYGTKAFRPEFGSAADSIGLDYRSREVEARALNAGTATQGGHAVPNENMAALYELQKYFSSVRQLANVIRTESGSTLPVPKIDDTSNSGEIIAEAGAVTTTVDPSFTQVTLTAFKYSSKAVLVSLEMLQDSSFPVEQYLARALAQRIARAQNAHFTTGSGSGQPQGYITGGTNGKTAAATNAIVYGELVDLLHSVDIAYRDGAAFLAHDSVIAYLRKLVDSQNRPLWQPGLIAGQPDQLLGFPVQTNNDQASTIATGNKTVAFANLRQAYMIRDAGISPDVFRLGELYLGTGQVGFMAFSRTDAKVLDATAVKFLTQA